MRRTLIVIVAALLGVLGVAPLPGAAAEGTWPGKLICAEGTLELGQYTQTGTMLAIQIQPCAGTDPAHGHYGLVTYTDNLAYLGDRSILPFPADGSPVSGLLTGEFRPANMDIGFGTIRAACVNVTPQVRIACVRLVELGGVVWVSPIPIDDPTVRHSATVLHDPGTDPVCAGCV